MSKGIRVGIIGAGAAGLSAAYELTKGGARVDVYEASGAVGGLARTFELWGQKVDLGPHRFFSTDRRVNQLWLEVVGRDYAMVDRLTRVFYRNKFFHYPLRPLDALSNLGPIEAARCTASYAREKVFPSNGAPADSFEGWVVNRFGRRLFEIFFKTYSEKLWGIPCDQLDSDFAAQRIKKLSLYEAIKNAFSFGGGNTHKTLVDRFAYPFEGTGYVYDRMAAAVRDGGGRVLLNQPVAGVQVENGYATGIALRDGTVEGYDHVISTMPLTSMVKSLSGAPQAVHDAADALRFRNTTLVYLNVDGTELFPDNWLYIHSPELAFGRVTNFRNWVPTLHRGASSSILALEYWSYDHDPLWHEADGSLIARASDEIRKTGLIGDARILGGHAEKIRRCYPVSARGYRERLDTVVRYLGGIRNLTPIGRYGSFKYNNQDHSLLMGLMAAENILAGVGNDLWSVNTDYEVYQEAAVITETGLADDPSQAAA